MTKRLPNGVDIDNSITLRMNDLKISAYLALWIPYRIEMLDKQIRQLNDIFSFGIKIERLEDE